MAKLVRGRVEWIAATVVGDLGVGRMRRGVGTRRSGFTVLGHRDLAALLLGLAVALVLASQASAQPPSPMYWSAPSVIDTRQIEGISCPSAALCVGVDTGGNVLSSTSPTGGVGAWAAAKIDDAPEEPLSWPNALFGVSCPVPAGSLCVAVGEGGIFVSGDPAGGASAWQPVAEVGVHSDAVSCPSASMCVVASGNSGEVIVSTDPDGGPGAWKTTKVDGGTPIERISCPTESLCVAVDEQGNVLTSTDPTGGGTWTAIHVASQLSGVSCPSASLCVVVGGSQVFTSTDPASGVWDLQEGTPGQGQMLSQVACPSSGLCVASGSNGTVSESTDPTGGPGAWTSTAGVDGTNRLSGVACVSPSLCFLTDETLVIGVPEHVLSVSVRGMGKVVAPLACPFGCTYSGPVCPRNCNGRFPNAYIPLRLAGISCSESPLFGPGDWGTCADSFPAEDAVTLTATPEAGSVFAGWGGACSGYPVCQVSMSADRDVTADFEAQVKSSASAPTLTHLSQAHAVWREGRSRRRAGKRPAVGTSFSFDLNENASVRLAFAAVTDGRRMGGSCAARNRTDRGHPRCARTIAIGGLTRAGHRGRNVVRFDGLLGHHTLAPGRYSVGLLATAGGLHSGLVQVRFTIAPG